MPAPRGGQLFYWYFLFNALYKVRGALCLVLCAGCFSFSQALAWGSRSDQLKENRFNGYHILDSPVFAERANMFIDRHR